MAIKICFVNFKGGVAKTTTAVNFAATLAKLDRKVLFVDLDPQSNASLWLMGEERFLKRIEDTSKTVYQVFLDRIPHVSGGHIKFRFKDCVVKAVARKKGASITPNLDLLPNTYHSIDLEHHLSASKAPTFDILKRALEDIEETYDYIIFDCAPNIYTTTTNALLFSDFYVIPVYPDYFAAAGLSILSRQIKRILSQYKGYIKEEPELLGVVITRIKEGASLDVGRKSSLENIVNNLIREKIISADAVVFDTYFNDTVEVARSIETFTPTIYHRTSYPPMREYIARMEKFTNTIIHRVE